MLKKKGIFYTFQVDHDNVTGYYQIPKLKKELSVPTSVIDFSTAMYHPSYANWVHFYLDDYRIERFWKQPERYLASLKKFRGVFSPDFSLYIDMPTSMKIWNVYRSRLLGQRMQYAGIHVIPTISWADADSFKYCFDGIEKNSVVTISTIGIQSQITTQKLFLRGLKAMIDTIQPEKIIVYGNLVSGMPLNIPYIQINSSTLSWKKQADGVKLREMNNGR
ncbi:MAG: DUF4417 domain-containing protein [Victivallaceae bacterium]|nr:DUF4417 domain-containing protein [Victivallaceae bacterium]